MNNGDCHSLIVLVNKMTTNAQLPVILEVGGNADEEKKEQRKRDKGTSDKTTALLSRLQLGSLQKLPQPGDVYNGPVSSNRPRPLGLIPSRNDRLAALKKLNQLLSPWATLQHAAMGGQPASGQCITKLKRPPPAAASTPLKESREQEEAAVVKAEVITECVQAGGSEPVYVVSTQPQTNAMDPDYMELRYGGETSTKLEPMAQHRQPPPSANLQESHKRSKKKKTVKR